MKSAELISRVRTLEQDHEPDGWPAIRMRDVSELANELERCVAALEYIATSDLSARHMERVARDCINR